MSLFIRIKFLLLIGCINSMSLKTEKNDCDIKRIDRCAQRMYIYGDPNFRVSTTVEEGQLFCKNTKEAEMCVRNYSKNCAKPFAQQYINLLVSGPSLQLKKRCTPSGIRKYLEHTKCINGTKAAIGVCNEQAIRDSMRIMKAKKDEWIPLSCCKSTQCSLKAINNDDLCDEKSHEYMKDAVKGFAGEMFDLFCGTEYQWGQNNCKKAVKDLVQIDPKIKRPLSVFPIVLEMMDMF